MAPEVIIYSSAGFSYTPPLDSFTLCLITAFGKVNKHGPLIPLNKGISRTADSHTSSSGTTVNIFLMI